MRSSKTHGDNGSGSLRSHLNDLDHVPAARIFLVRKTQQLGLNSADALHSYFSTWGVVEDVLMSHTLIMSGCQGFVKRIRPSNLAIVVMSSTSAVEAIHRTGTEHLVRATLVHVERYVRREACEADCFGGTSTDGVSTGDWGSSGSGSSIPESSDEEACITDDFEYWATDNEFWSTGDWGKTGGFTCIPESSDEEACVTDAFEYWATDDEF